MSEKPPAVSASSTPPSPRANVRRTRHWSTVWIVPAVAAMIAGWLVWQHYAGQGPMAQVQFQTAEGLQSEKTEVRCRSVKVGLVESMTLSKDLSSVMVALRIEPKFSGLLRQGARFWVVRPRVSASDISGLGTLITGVYIELDPGESGGEDNVRQYKGLEAPPVTASNVPGLRLTLVADTTGSLGVGAPIYYKGYEVGRVELRNFDTKVRKTRFEVFIQKDYASLVTEGTRFWNASGIDVAAGAEGLKVHSPSFQAMVAGGASFGVPPEIDPGKPVKDHAEFTLFQDEAAARKPVVTPNHRCLVFFDQSVRGLRKDAPVEFRGISMGRVADISMKYAGKDDTRVPVLIEIDVGVLSKQSPKSAPDESRMLADAVKRGLRAKLGTGSLLTGALFIDMDYVKDVPSAELARQGDLDVLPTQSSGLVQLEAKVNAVLAKIQALPIEETLQKYGKTADELTARAAEAKAMLDDIHQLLAKDETQNITKEIDKTLREVRSSVGSLGPSGSVQGDLRRTLDELRAALRSIKVLSDTVADKPNSLIFGKDNSGNPIPRARKVGGN